MDTLGRKGLSAIGKLYGTVLIGWFRSKTEEILEGKQIGFRKERRCIDHISVVGQMYEKYKEKEMELLDWSWKGVGTIYHNYRGPDVEVPTHSRDAYKKLLQ